MHGVPADLDLTPFIGCTLDEIGLGAHQLQFKFSGLVGRPSPSLAVESHWEFRGSSGELLDKALDDQQLPSDRVAYRVHLALTHTVVRVALDPPKSITFEFEDGATLTVWDSNAPYYESFHVEPGGYHI